MEESAPIEPLCTMYSLRTEDYCTVCTRMQTCNDPGQTWQRTAAGNMLALYCEWKYRGPPGCISSV